MTLDEIRDASLARHAHRRPRVVHIIAPAALEHADRVYQLQRACLLRLSHPAHTHIIASSSSRFATMDFVQNLDPSKLVFAETVS